MSLKENLDLLWNESETNISEIIKKGITLLEKAIENNEDLPLEDIFSLINKANTISNFGNEFSEAKLMIKIFNQSKKSDQLGDLSAYYRFICTLFSSLFALQVVDVVNDGEELHEIIEEIEGNVEELETASLTNLLTFYNICEGLIIPNKINNWYLELTGYLTTLRLILIEYGKVEPNKLDYIQNHYKFLKLKAREGNPEIASWKESWNESSDYFRFFSMMVFNKTPKNSDIWIETMNEVLN